MKIPVYSATGVKKREFELPPSLFGVKPNEGLMHQVLLLQQSNRRSPIAHTGSRSEIQGSTRKLYQQKGTGRARRGPIRSPLLRGGNKAFGPKKDANFMKRMPKTMRHQALCSCLSLKARVEGALLGLEGYPETVKTKEFVQLFKKLPVSLGRRILVVLGTKHRALTLSARNVPGVKTILASYLNPEDVLVSRNIIFLEGAIEKVEKVFGKVSSEQKSVNSTKHTDHPAAKVRKSAPRKRSSPTPSS